MTHFRHALDDTQIDDLLASYRPGYSLEQAFYFSPEIFEEEFTHSATYYVVAGGGQRVRLAGHLTLRRGLQR